MGTIREHLNGGRLPFFKLRITAADPSSDICSRPVRFDLALPDCEEIRERPDCDFALHAAAEYTGDADGSLNVQLPPA